MARIVNSPPLRELFVFCPRVCTRKDSGTRTLNSHFLGAPPPLAKSPCGGSNSGLHPCAGRKKASFVKLKPASPAAGGKYSTERCSVWRASVVHGSGKEIVALRGLSVEFCVVTATVSQ